MNTRSRKGKASAPSSGTRGNKTWQEADSAWATLRLLSEAKMKEQGGRTLVVRFAAWNILGRINNTRVLATIQGMLADVDVLFLLEVGSGQAIPPELQAAFRARRPCGGPQQGREDVVVLSRWTITVDDVFNNQLMNDQGGNGRIPITVTATSPAPPQVRFRLAGWHAPQPEDFAAIFGIFNSFQHLQQQQMSPYVQLVIGDLNTERSAWSAYFFRLMSSKTTISSTHGVLVSLFDTVLARASPRGVEGGSSSTRGQAATMLRTSNFSRGTAMGFPWQT